ncbi:MAG: N-methyl-L-tryptophan oxidase [Gemmatimonadaceae bacterium]
MHDVLVVGLGAMGSAVLHHLAARGAKVVGVDRFDPPHALGSTHGRSRIIREAYFEHPGYVPLVRRAYENWDALEQRSGMHLFARTGGLMIGAPDGELVRGASESAMQHDIDVELLSATAIAARFPALAPGTNMVGVLERRAGVLFPEACVEAHLRLAREDGAEVRTSTRVEAIETGSGRVRALTGAGVIDAQRVVLAAGPWTSELLAPLGVALPLRTERQTMHWLDSDASDARFAPEQMPVALIEHAPGQMFYALPDFGDGVKAAVHHDGDFITIDAIAREVTESDTRPVLDLAARFIPAAPTRIRDSAVCVYTNTPDQHFVVDTLAAAPQVTLVSACSGHGFKFASAIGEVVAARLLGEAPAFDLPQFSLARFG